MMTPALYQWAWAVYRAGDRAKAHELFEKFLRDHPSSAWRGEVACRLAEDALRAGDHARASELLADISESELSPELHIRALLLAGQLGVAQEKWGTVAAPFEKMLELDPPAAMAEAAAYWIAEAAYRQGNVDEAAERFAAIASKLPAAPTADEPAWHAIVFIRRAQLFAAQGEWTKATDEGGRGFTQVSGLRAPVRG